LEPENLQATLATTYSATRATLTSATALTSLLTHVPGLAAAFLLTLTSLLTQFPGPATTFSFSTLTSRLSGRAKILKYFHVPFAIFSLSFAIARSRAGQAMTKDK
jgi:hypothetical protein